MSKQFTLTDVKALADGVLALTYADGEQLQVDVKPIIAKHPTLRELGKPAVFKRAKLGDWGGSVTWGTDDLELAADNLRARAIEQAGGVSHEFIINWMAKHDLSLDTAARALDISRRMLAYYRSGEKPVPRTVALACLGGAQTARATDVFRLEGFGAVSRAMGGVATAIDTASMALAPRRDLLSVPSRSIRVLSMKACSSASRPIRASEISVLTFSTACRTPLPK